MKALTGTARWARTEGLDMSRTLVASNKCTCCGRALTDAVSVARGIGPDCWEIYGIDSQVAPIGSRARRAQDAVKARVDEEKFWAAHEARFARFGL